MYETMELTHGLEYVQGYMEVAPELSLTAAKEDLYQQIQTLRRMDIDRAIVAADEGLWQVIKTILTAIGNVSIHLANLVKTNIFKFYKSLKRTEIVYYNESNKISMLRIWSCSEDELKDMVLPFPNGFKTTYLDALDKTYTALDVLDITTRAQIAITVSTNILNGLKHGGMMSDIIASGITSVDTTKVKIPVDLALKCIDDTKNTSREERTFTQLFGNVATMKLCNDKAISFTKHVDQTNLVHKKLAICSDITNEIVKTIERTAGQGVNKADVENIAQIAYVLADTFDMFAQCLLQFHKLEHNQVECYKEIRRKLSI